MTFGSPRMHKRKGRPKRKGLQIQNDQQHRYGDNNGFSEQDMSTKEIQQQQQAHSVYDKLREERPYKDFYPDLNITQTLTIVRQTKSPFSDYLVAPLMNNDTTIMTELSTIHVDTTTIGSSSPTDINNKTPSLDNEDNGMDLSDNNNNNILDDTIICSTSPTLPEEAIVSTTSNPEDMVSSPQQSSSSPIHETDMLQTPTTTMIQPTNSTDTVDLTSLPKPSFRKVTDDTDDPSKINATTHTSASSSTTTTTTNIRRNSKRKQSNEPSTDTALDLDIECDNGDKGNNDDNSDSGNESSERNMGYRRPENHYIRYIEPTEQSLFDMVEYDMDEQDDAWLQMLNVERKINRLGHVSCSFFENVIDKLEKEWFNLIKHLPKQTDAEPLLSEDSACSICDDGECENSNAIVFCDGCNLAVHQDCYGVPYIPEGQWLCRKCMVSPDKPVSCLFCPNEGGAFKQTNTNKWGHLLCALWIPEVGVSNSIYMEPIDNIEGIPKSRWKLTCYICKKRHGACIQCDNKHCFTAFHVTCARWARLCMRMKTHGAQGDSVLLKAYCDRHTPRDYRDEVDVEKCVLAAQKFLDPKAPKNQGRPSSSCTPRRRYVDELDADGMDDDDDDDDDDKSTSGKQRHHLDQSNTNKRKRNDKNLSQRTKRRQTSQHLTPSIKAARAHQHHYSAGAPIAPDFILTRLENMKCVRQAVHLRRRCQLVASICRYWSLKRESRRGAPLLKRLHLEPWTASSSQLKQNELEKAQRAKALFELRADLEVVRMLSEQVQKRERQKLEKLRRQKEYIEMILFPVEYIIRPILNQLMEMDKKEYFLYPVTADVAPDYLEFIDHPMSFHDIIEKFHAHEYTTINAVEADLSLIWANSKTYNQPDTSYYKLAQRMEEQTTELITKAQQYYNVMDISQYTGTLAFGIDPEIFSYNLAEITPLPAEAKMEMDAPLGNTSEQSQKDEGMAPASESTTKLTPTNISKRPATRSNQEKNRQESLSKRTTRSSSTDVVHINLDDRPRKRKKLIQKLSSSPVTPVSASASTPTSSSSPIPSPHNTSVSAPTISEEKQPTKSTTQIPQASIENHLTESTETMTTPFDSSSPAHEQPPSSPSLLPISSEKQTSSEQHLSPSIPSEKQSSLPLSEQLLLPPVSSEKQASSLPSSSEQQSPPSSLSNLQSSPPSLPLSSEQQSSPLLLSELQSSPPISPGKQSLKQQSPPPLSSEQQILSRQQQQPLVVPSSTKSHTSILSTISVQPTLSVSHAPSNPSSHIKRNNKPKNDNVVSRRRTRSSGSDGLTIPTKNGMKNRKMNKETRKLLMPETMDKPVAYEEGSYKESTTRRAPCGYVYISSSDDDGDDDQENIDIDGDDDSTTDTDQRSNMVYSSTAISFNENNNITTGSNQTDNIHHPLSVESNVKQETNNLSNAEITELRQPKPKPKPSPAKKTKAPKSSPAKKTKAPKPPLFSKELHTTAPGEIVWARVPGFPYHPAKIIDVEQPGFSKKLLENRTKEKTVLVKFYQVPESHKWGWIKPTNIYKFGNEENDRLMLEDAKVVKKSKKSRFNEVFDGYEYVCLKLGLQALQI